MTSTTESVAVKVWELKAGSVNDYAPLVFASERDAASGMFDVSGRPLAWSKTPKVEVFVEPGRKAPKPLADVSALTPGALAMSDKAKAALEPFLGQFGEFLKMDCNGAPWWFYNVTNLVSCVDEARSVKKPSGALSKEAFFEAKVPQGAVVFKDPLTAPASVYVTDTAKATLEECISQAGITGLAIVEPGPGPKKPRPRG
jgi:hypothetical protein